MSEIPADGEPTGWAGTVEFAPGPDGFAYRPDELIVGGQPGRDRAQEMFVGTFESVEPVFPDVDEGVGAGQLYLLRGTVDAIEAVEELRVEGVLAQPNHVMFAHDGGCDCCGPHPSVRWGGLTGSPMHASPMHASPMHASPMHASPMHASPMHASDLQATGRRRSSAIPSGPRPRPRLPGIPTRVVRVAVLDTGMAADDLRPRALDSMAPQQRDHWERPDPDGDGHLDPAAGHGTFIAGLIDLVTPGCEISVEKVLSSYGEGDEVAVARRIHALAGTVDLVNLSFGGYAMEQMHVLAAAIRRASRLGTVVVASAGNDATCRPTYPAALRGVVGVGAIGPHGPAPFTNYGPWVRACAPGVDIVSWFFTEYDGLDTASTGAPDPDRFRSWARWSGTSFAAPMVVAALAREMATYAVSAADAVGRVIDDPDLLRLPDLGTVVNLS
jgi:hypothetical protein